MVGALSSTDPDSPLGDTATYSLVDDAGGRFGISGTSLVAANGSLLDFETSTSHQVTVRVTDVHGAHFDKLFTINVTNVNDAPIITSNGSGASATVFRAENATAVTTVVASDVDNRSLAVSISGGADAGRFTIDASGHLAFRVAPDFENPTDVGEDNHYQVTVRVSDGALADLQAIMVAVTDVEKPPVKGSSGKDVLIGRNGHDTINGGLGNDTLTGGGGRCVSIHQQTGQKEHRPRHRFHLQRRYD